MESIIKSMVKSVLDVLFKSKSEGKILKTDEIRRQSNIDSRIQRDSFYKNEETKIINLKKTIQKANSMTREELYQVGKWKTKRVSKRILNNTDSFTQEITEKAFTATDDWDKLQMLTHLEGIGHARASAILHLYDKKIYPVLDMHANFSIGFKRMARGYYTKKFWIEYIQYFRNLVSEHKITEHRHLDRALWRYSYEQSIAEKG